MWKRQSQNSANSLGIWVLCFNLVSPLLASEEAPRPVISWEIGFSKRSLAPDLTSGPVRLSPQTTFMSVWKWTKPYVLHYPSNPSDLEVHTLFLSSRDPTRPKFSLVVASVDTVHIPDQLIKEVRDRVAELGVIPKPFELMIVASGWPYTPDVASLTVRDRLFSSDEAKYKSYLAKQIVQSIENAFEQRQEGQLYSMKVKNPFFAPQRRRSHVNDSTFHIVQARNKQATLIGQVIYGWLPKPPSEKGYEFPVSSGLPGELRRALQTVSESRFQVYLPSGLYHTGASVISKKSWRQDSLSYFRKALISHLSEPVDTDGPIQNKWALEQIEIELPQRPWWWTLWMKMGLFDQDQALNTKKIIGLSLGKIMIMPLPGHATFQFQTDRRFLFQNRSDVWVVNSTNGWGFQFMSNREQLFLSGHFSPLFKKVRPSSFTERDVLDLQKKESL